MLAYVLGGWQLTGIFRADTGTPFSVTANSGSCNCTSALTERFGLEFRSEFYNLTNTPHFANPASTGGNSNFGQITSTLSGYGARQVQFALRLTF